MNSKKLLAWASSAAIAVSSLSMALPGVAFATANDGDTMLYGTSIKEIDKTSTATVENAIKYIA